MLYLCERGCGKEVALRKRKDHNEKRCEYRDMVCERPDCGGRFIASLEWQHNRFECKSVGVQMKRAAAEKRAVAGRGEGRGEGQQSGGEETEKVGGAQRRSTVNVQDVVVANRKEEACSREDAEAAIGALQSGSALL